MNLRPSGYELDTLYILLKQTTEGEQKGLRELYRQTQNADVRTRCQMILLSFQEYAVSEIAELTLFNEDSVLY